MRVAWLLLMTKRSSSSGPALGAGNEEKKLRSARRDGKLTVTSRLVYSLTCIPSRKDTSETNQIKHLVLQEKPCERYRENRILTCTTRMDLRWIGVLGGSIPWSIS
jgi:hypothetical protein